MTLPAGNIRRIDDYRVRIEQPGRAPCMIYATERLFSAIQQDATLTQVVNVASLPGLVGPSMVMPDAHQGYGFAIGGVAATDVVKGGVVSPGGVGFDINCGVRLLATTIPAEEARPHLEALLDLLFETIPVGFGRSRRLSVTGNRMDDLLRDGARWAVREGFGTEADLARCEERGAVQGADPGQVSLRAKERGAEQVGTLGSGNHFVEIQRVEAIQYPEAAETMGLVEGGLVFLVHTGSRGLGHQVCSDHVRELGRAMSRYGIKVPDRQLACAPALSPEGETYLGAMAAAANFAWANRQLITHYVRSAVVEVLGPRHPVSVVYDVAHNMARLERHDVEGRERLLCVHRKGATRAFPAGHPRLPREYHRIGQPVFIPGSMGTSSEVLVGTPVALQETWGSVCHGAGRTMSRSAAKKRTSAREVVDQLAARGISIRAGSKKGIAEEAPAAYKDVVSVVDTVVGAGLARRVARLVPMGVIKG